MQRNLDRRTLGNEAMLKPSSTGARFVWQPHATGSTLHHPLEQLAVLSLQVPISFFINNLAETNSLQAFIFVLSCEAWIGCQYLASQGNKTTHWSF
jgi:hypothetical protein